MTKMNSPIGTNVLGETQNHMISHALLVQHYFAQQAWHYLPVLNSGTPRPLSPPADRRSQDALTKAPRDRRGHSSITHKPLCETVKAAALKHLHPPPITFPLLTLLCSPSSQEVTARRTQTRWVLSANHWAQGWSGNPTHRSNCWKKCLPAVNCDAVTRCSTSLTTKSNECARRTDELYRHAKQKQPGTRANTV